MAKRKVTQHGGSSWGGAFGPSKKPGKGKQPGKGKPGKLGGLANKVPEELKPNKKPSNMQESVSNASSSAGSSVSSSSNTIDPTPSFPTLGPDTAAPAPVEEAKKEEVKEEVKKEEEIKPEVKPEVKPEPPKPKTAKSLSEMIKGIPSNVDIKKELSGTGSLYPDSFQIGNTVNEEDFTPAKDNSGLPSPTIDMSKVRVPGMFIPAGLKDKNQEDADDLSIQQAIASVPKKTPTEKKVDEEGRVDLYFNEATKPEEMTNATPEQIDEITKNNPELAEKLKESAKSMLDEGILNLDKQIAAIDRGGEVDYNFDATQIGKYEQANNIGLEMYKALAMEDPKYKREYELYLEKQKEYEAKKAEYEAAKADYDAKMNEYNAAMDKYNADMELYDKNSADYEAKKAEYEADVAEFNKKQEAYQAEMNKYEADMKAYEEGKLKVEEAQKSWLDNVETQRSQAADADLAFDDALVELDAQIAQAEKDAKGFFKGDEKKELETLKAAKEELLNIKNQNKEILDYYSLLGSEYEVYKKNPEAYTKKLKMQQVQDSFNKSNNLQSEAEKQALDAVEAEYNTKENETKAYYFNEKKKVEASDMPIAKKQEELDRLDREKNAKAESLKEERKAAEEKATIDALQSQVNEMKDKPLIDLGAEVALAMTSLPGISKGVSAGAKVLSGGKEAIKEAGKHLGKAAHFAAWNIKDAAKIIAKKGTLTKTAKNRLHEAFSYVLKNEVLPDAGALANIVGATTANAAKEAAIAGTSAVASGAAKVGSDAITKAKESNYNLSQNVDMENLEIPEKPTAPEIFNEAMPQAPDMPEMPQKPEDISLPDMPTAPDIPQLPEMPARPELPDLETFKQSLESANVSSPEDIAKMTEVYGMTAETLIQKPELAGDANKMLDYTRDNYEAIQQEYDAALKEGKDVSGLKEKMDYWKNLSSDMNIKIGQTAMDAAATSAQSYNPGNEQGDLNFIEKWKIKKNEKKMADLAFNATTSAIEVDPTSVNKLSNSQIAMIATPAGADHVIDSVIGSPEASDNVKIGIDTAKTVIKEVLSVFHPNGDSALEALFDISLTGQRATDRAQHSDAINALMSGDLEAYKELSDKVISEEEVHTGQYEGSEPIRHQLEMADAGVGVPGKVAGVIKTIAGAGQIAAGLAIPGIDISNALKIVADGTKLFTNGASSLLPEDYKKELGEELEELEEGLNHIEEIIKPEDITPGPNPDITPPTPTPDPDTPIEEQKEVDDKVIDKGFKPIVFDPNDVDTFTETTDKKTNIIDETQQFRPGEGVEKINEAMQGFNRGMKDETSQAISDEDVKGFISRVKHDPLIIAFSHRL